MKTFDSKIEKDLLYLWGKVGFIVHLSQLVEYNLANILSADELLKEFEERNSMCIIEYNEFAQRSNDLYRKLSKMSLGKILKQAKRVNFFTDEGLNILKNACTKRNYIIHQMFRDDLGTKHLETNPQFYYGKLEETIALLNEINEILVDIFANQKEEFKFIY